MRIFAKFSHEVKEEKRKTWNTSDYYYYFVSNTFFFHIESLFKAIITNVHEDIRFVLPQKTMMWYISKSVADQKS